MLQPNNVTLFQADLWLENASSLRPETLGLESSAKGLLPGICFDDFCLSPWNLKLKAFHLVYFA